MNEEYDYMEGFEDLGYVEPSPEGYEFVSIDMRKLSEAQMNFLKNTLDLEVTFCDFEDDLYLTKWVEDPDEGWYTYEELVELDKEISFNDIFKYKEQ